MFMFKFSRAVSVLGEGPSPYSFILAANSPHNLQIKLERSLVYKPHQSKQQQSLTNQDDFSPKQLETSNNK